MKCGNNMANKLKIDKSLIKDIIEYDNIYEGKMYFPAFIFGPYYLLLKGCIEAALIFCIVNLLFCYFLFPAGYILILANHFVIAFLFRFIYYYSLSSYAKKNASLDDISLMRGYQKRKDIFPIMIIVYLLALVIITALCLAKL